jgi:hypothetical protein
MYKIIKFHPNGVEETSIIRDNGNGNYTSFPINESNTNYQEYLKWVAEGNTPTPADE